MEKGADSQTLALPPAGESVAAGRQSRTPWLTILAWTWGAGTVLLACGHACRIVRFRRLLRAAETPPSALLGMAEAMGRRLGLRRTAEIALLPVRVSPLVWSLGGRPRVFLPAALFQRLDADAQQAILAHELAHVRRHDHWVRLLELAIATLFWWHPVVWWACRQLRELEEQCCDAMVLGAAPHGARAYATALLDTLDFLSERPVAVPPMATAANSPASLARRIIMLKDYTPPTPMTVRRLALLIAVAAVPMAMAFAAGPPEKEDGARPGDREPGRQDAPSVPQAGGSDADATLFWNSPKVLEVQKKFQALCATFTGPLTKDNYEERATKIADLLKEQLSIER